MKDLIDKLNKQVSESLHKRPEEGITVEKMVGYEDLCNNSLKEVLNNYQCTKVVQFNELLREEEGGICTYMRRLAEAKSFVEFFYNFEAETVKKRYFEKLNKLSETGQLFSTCVYPTIGKLPGVDSYFIFSVFHVKIQN